MEEGLRQVGHKVYFADGEVFSGPCCDRVSLTMVSFYKIKKILG